MKHSLLASLLCADCNSPFQSEAGEGQSGMTDCLLRCDCPGAYPVTNGIPRLLPLARIESANEKAEMNDELRKFLKKWERTQRSFGTQWNRYEVQCPEEDVATFRAKTGFATESLHGLKVLDAGCGGGRYSFVAGKAGADVISVDISSAVNKAAQLCSSLDNVNIIQANLMELPLRRQSFDRIFSIGVLHHTPDTRAAFDALVPLLKPGGQISIWLYPQWDWLRETSNKFWRSLSTRMPHSLVHGFSVATSPLGSVRGHVYSNGPKWLSRVLWQTDKLIPGISNHPDPRQRVCDTFDWLTPQYQWHHTDEEVRDWFESAGLRDIVNLSESQSRYHDGQGEGICFTGTFPGT